MSKVEYHRYVNTLPNELRTRLNVLCGEFAEDQLNVFRGSPSKQQYTTFLHLTKVCYY